MPQNPGMRDDEHRQDTWFWGGIAVEVGLLLAMTIYLIWLVR